MFMVAIGTTMVVKKAAYQRHALSIGWLDLKEIKKEIFLINKKIKLPKKLRSVMTVITNFFFTFKLMVNFSSCNPLDYRIYCLEM